MTIKLIIDENEYEPTENERKAASVEMWYDRHRREWVIYPVDANGYQVAPARYAFSKSEAKDNMAKAAADLAAYGFGKDAEQLMRMVYRLEAFQNKCR